MPGVNSLTRSVSLRVGPIVLETLVKHYLEKIKRDFQSSNKDEEKQETVRLRQDELMYDEIFTVVKAFLEAATLHSVEDIQAFSNTRTPSPPWVHVVRVRIPMSSCDEAASYLITALGGQDIAARLVGGVKWWQVRSIDGVDAQWITAKKDWQEAKRRYKEREKTRAEPLDQAEDATYDEDMDTMRCILYAHGGGYYFGSVDQERYSIQRYARKINGRVLAINYRLAPQYPFPCAIQDLVAAYLYLIRPPPGACHAPVKPSHIVVAGDSAGGGLTLALLQVLRDASLPLPAGGVLISPWCDMTHSFPSIHTNTQTDVIPPYGLSMHKPSTLWPPPDEELTNRIRTGLRTRFRAVFKGEGDPNASVASLGLSGPDTTPIASLGFKTRLSSGTLDVGTTTPLPQPATDGDSFQSRSPREPIVIKAQNGEVLSIQHQIQLYTTNTLLGHPLVSPALGYLGGLPPLMVVISDREVLRDEGIYMAHKAAHPDQFPIRDATKELYPALYGIEERFKKPTPVHLQVYDDTAHVLPVLFSFTTPAKYCFRAMAIFCDLSSATSQLTTGPKSQNTPQAATGDSASGGLFSLPRSPRSVGSFTSRLSIRRKGRTSESRPDLKRSASEHQGSKSSSSSVSRGKGKARSFSIPRLRKQASTVGQDVEAEENSFYPRNERGKSEQIMTPKKELTGISPVPPLPLPSALKFSAQQTHSPPASLSSNSLLRSSSFMAGLDNDSPNAVSSSPSMFSLALGTAQGTIISAINQSVTDGKPSPASSSSSIVHGNRANDVEIVSIEGLPFVPSPAPTLPPSSSMPNNPHSHLRREFSEDKNGFKEQIDNERCAGDPIVYSETADFPSLYTSIMIRERVSTRGVIRPLEPWSSLPALNVPPQQIGEISELSLRRYIAGRTLFDNKFASTIKAIEKRRKKHLKKARKDTIKNMSALKGSVEREREKLKSDDSKTHGNSDKSEITSPSSKDKGDTHDEAPFSIKTALLASSGWSWSWALDQNEHPPPSSLVARRDTHEALMLARIADQAVLQDEQVGGLEGAMTGNNLWSLVVGYLTPGGGSDAVGTGSGREKENIEREREGVTPESTPSRWKGKAKADADHGTANEARSTFNLSSPSFSPSKLGLGKIAFRSKLTSIGSLHKASVSQKPEHPEPE
ncbi:hypothetical protein BDP27DRAFT_1418782 [Rhodocollybia butyracea]|uniref:Alpha/beta hydrolase fold-3 domain-containing protein n=1 Tax=Rhodocollybia butyracea TaxID=206335 RepID=A0A9P5UA59_9AGAR|nr:hypothetical protein BDP27DRAFT_1418782 [Rhodocollybia butyracea]